MLNNILMLDSAKKFQNLFRKITAMALILRKIC
jgi:hypothetical protein